MLTSHQIKLEMESDGLIIKPLDKIVFNPNSVNLTLANTLLTYKTYVVDSNVNNETNEYKIPKSGFTLQPEIVYLGATNETTICNTVIPAIAGRSSIGRLGLFVHTSAGFGDIGFNGTWTLELVATQPVVVYPDMEICQISFTYPQGEVKELYNGRYQGQVKPKAHVR